MLKNVNTMRWPRHERSYVATMEELLDSDVS